MGHAYVYANTIGEFWYFPHTRVPKVIKLISRHDHPCAAQSWWQDHHHYRRWPLSSCTCTSIDLVLARIEEYSFYLSSEFGKPRIASISQTSMLFARHCAVTSRSLDMQDLYCSHSHWIIGIGAITASRYRFIWSPAFATPAFFSSRTDTPLVDYTNVMLSLSIRKRLKQMVKQVCNPAFYTPSLK